VPEGDEGGVVGGGEGEVVAWWGISGVCCGVMRKMRVSGGFGDFEGIMGEMLTFKGLGRGCVGWGEVQDAEGMGDCWWGWGRHSGG